MSKESITMYLNNLPDKRVTLQLIEVFAKTHGSAVIAATGTNQATGALLTAAVNAVSGADGTKGVRLPTPNPDDPGVWVINTHASNALKIYPDVSGQINALGADAAYTLAAAQAGYFIPASRILWYTGIVGATSAQIAFLTGAVAGTSAPSKVLVLDASGFIDTFGVGAITAADASLGITGLTAAQGGAIVLTGGTSSTATNAGGAVTHIGGTGNTSGAGGESILKGGAGGATGVGGQVTITGGVPTDAAGGAVVIAGGAGVGTNRAGGLASVTGGASTGSATGGVASIVGGAAGAATGAGGGVVVTAANGNTTGAAGTVLITSGAGGATNVAGGVVTITGGIGNGTGIGGVASLIGGVGGTSGATGKGGAAKVTGGASVATNADGGGVVLGGGAKNGTAFIGPIVLGSAQLTPIWYPQAAPKADGGDAAQTITVAEMVAGLVSSTPAQARAVTTPTGAELDAGLAFADVPATFGFDFTVQNRAAFAATDDILTLTAGASGVTVTGSAVVSPGSAARFRATRTGAATYIIYKIAG